MIIQGFKKAKTGLVRGVKELWHRGGETVDARFVRRSGSCFLLLSAAKLPFSLRTSERRSLGWFRVRVLSLPSTHKKSPLTGRNLNGQDNNLVTFKNSRQTINISSDVSHVGGSAQDPSITSAQI